MKIFGKKVSVPNPTDVLHDAHHQAQQAVSAAPDAVQDAVQEALAEVPPIVEAALEHMIEAAASGILDKAVKVLHLAVPSRVKLTVGPVGLHISSVDGLIDSLDAWAHHPPTDANGVRMMIEDLAPDSVSITLTAELALVVVSSASLSLGMEPEWDKDDFLTHLDDLIGAL